MRVSDLSYRLPTGQPGELRNIDPYLLRRGHKRINDRFAEHGGETPHLPFGSLQLREDLPNFPKAQGLWINRHDVLHQRTSGATTTPSIIAYEATAAR